jgi:hypothetical protein
MRMDCETAREHLEAWGLGALDGDERRAVDAHLATCDACTALADEARETSGALGLAVPLASPSTTVKARVLAGAAVLTDIRNARFSAWRRAAVAALAVFAIGSVAWGTVVQMQVNDLDGERENIAAGATAQAAELAELRQQLVDASQEAAQLETELETQRSVLDVAFETDVQSTELAGTPMAPGARGRCMWSRANALGAFVAQDLPTLPAGASYRLWLVYEDGAWVNAGAFTVDETGEARMILKTWGDRSHGRITRFAVTREPLYKQDDKPSQQLVLASS